MVNKTTRELCTPGLAFVFEEKRSSCCPNVGNLPCGVCWPLRQWFRSPAAPGRITITKDAVSHTSIARRPHCHTLLTRAATAQRPVHPCTCSKTAAPVLSSRKRMHRQKPPHRRNKMGRTALVQSNAFCFIKIHLQHCSALCLAGCSTAFTSFSFFMTLRRSVETHFFAICMPYPNHIRISRLRYALLPGTRPHS